jgi:hypothetical protein
MPIAVLQKFIDSLCERRGVGLYGPYFLNEKATSESSMLGNGNGFWVLAQNVGFVNYLTSTNGFFNPQTY